MVVDYSRKWRTWLDRIQRDQLQDLLINQYIFERYRDVVKPLNGSNQRPMLAEWLTQGQLAFICTAIRRITEKKGRWKIVSLRKLLDDMDANGAFLTRAKFKEMYAASVVAPFADRDFDRLAGRGAMAFPASKIAADVQQIESCAETAKRLSDKVIAHTEQNRAEVGVPPTYGQLNRAVVWLTNVYKKYHFLITAQQYAPPQFEEYDFTSDFKLLFEKPGDQ